MYEDRKAFWTVLTDCNTPLCALIYAWGLDESSAWVCLFVLEVSFMCVHIWMHFACLWCVHTLMQCELCIAVFTCVLGGGWSSQWLLCQRLFSCNKAWFKVDQSTLGIVPRPSFPLQPVEMRSLHNIYPGNNDVWFDSLLGVSLWGLFSSTAATERENRQKICPQEKKKKKEPQIIVYGWC